jgi:hypothetical protein
VELGTLGGVIAIKIQLGRKSDPLIWVIRSLVFHVTQVD